MDNRDAVITLQSRRIAELCGQLETVTGERDMLLLELQQLRCQLELRELSAHTRSVGQHADPGDGPGSRAAACAVLAAGAVCKERGCSVEESMVESWMSVWRMRLRPHTPNRGCLYGRCD